MTDLERIEQLVKAHGEYRLNIRLTQLLDKLWVLERNAADSGIRVADEVIAAYRELLK